MATGCLDLNYSNSYCYFSALSSWIALGAFIQLQWQPYWTVPILQMRRVGLPELRNVARVGVTGGLDKASGSRAPVSAYSTVFALCVALPSPPPPPHGPQTGLSPTPPHWARFSRALLLTCSPASWGVRQAAPPPMPPTLGPGDPSPPLNTRPQCSWMILRASCRFCLPSPNPRLSTDEPCCTNPVLSTAMPSHPLPSQPPLNAPPGGGTFQGE